MEVYEYGKEEPYAGRNGAPRKDPGAAAGSNISSMEDIQNLFRETIAEFMETGLDAELDDELGYSKYDYRNKETDNSRNGHSSNCINYGLII